MDAATVPLSVITAWQALFVHAGFHRGLDDHSAKGKRVLVTAAAGGVGVWVVQLARLAGMYVLAQISSEENAAFVGGLGANEMVDYHRQTLKEWAEKQGRVDIVIDCAGGETLEEAWHAVSEGGKLLSIVEPREGRRPAELAGRRWIICSSS